MLNVFYIYLLLFISMVIVLSSSGCEKNTLPSSIEVTDSDEIILKCSKPKHSIVQKNRYEFFKNESWHLYALNFKLCTFNYTSDKCNSSNGEWISGINSQNSRNINVTCCYNNALKKSKHLKYFYLEKGQRIKAGEIIKNGNFTGFAYISNVIKIINYDHSVTFKVFLNQIQYQKQKLQMHTFNENKKIGDSKKVSELSPFNDEEEDLTLIDFGVCDNNEARNLPEKPCTSQFSKLELNSNSRSTVTKNMHPFSRKLYQAPLRPGTNNNNPFLPSLEPPETDDFSIDFGGGDQCPFNGVDDTETTSTNVETEIGNNEATNANVNSNANANSNTNANFNSNSNTNSNSNSNSQSNSNQNSQSNSNQNSQSNSNQNTQSNSNQNSQSNSNQNSQSQSQNINSQIIQSQNPVNPLLVMQMPNIPFAQAPVPPSGGFNGLAGFAGAGGGGGGCFSGDTKVYTINGKTKRMDELQIDDWVFSSDVDGRFGFSRVISWLHRMPKQKYEFIKISLKNGKTLSITKKHYIYVSNCFESNATIQAFSQRYIEAEKIQISDCLLHLNNKNQFQSIQIIKIESAFKEGIYAPLTGSGNIIVNGILASCFSEIDSFPISSLSTKLNRYYETVVNLFKEVFFESLNNSQNKQQNEIDLIPGTEIFIESLKTILYPNYRKSLMF